MPEHLLAERHLISLVESGEWTIDDLGQVWRQFSRRGPGCAGGRPTVPCDPRRAERYLKGYLNVRSLIDGRRWTAGAHRLVWQHIHGDIPQGLTINHIDGHPDHNWISNLELATYSENMLHAHRTGLAHNPTGERAHKAKLSDADVAALREDMRAGMPRPVAAVKYGVDVGTVSRLTNRRYRADLDALAGMDLVGSTEIAKMAGTSRQSIIYWSRHRTDFPVPVATPVRTWMWSKPDIEAWCQSHADDAHGGARISLILNQGDPHL